MNLSDKFVRDLKYVHPKAFMESLQREDRPSFRIQWVLIDELRPIDLFCYLTARFGPPNGPQSFLRNDHSDNLIHWEWVLQSKDRFILLQGHSYRTELWLSGDLLPETARDDLVLQFKAAFAGFGRDMGEVRKSLEHWVEFVNPYQRIRRSISQLMEDINRLDIDIERDRITDISHFANPEDYAQVWKERAERYSRAIGISFGIRSMLPVLAEAFVNLLMYILMKPDLRNDERLRENALRQPIDIRVRSLSHNCNGFKQRVDFGADPCREYHSLVNERNDLLHGNVVVDKLRFNELYFKGTVPVFIKYSSMWERAYGVSLGAAGFTTIKSEYEVVNRFIEYLMSCLEGELAEQVKFISDRYHLGVCLDDGRNGVLFPEHLVDFAVARGGV